MNETFYYLDQEITLAADIIMKCQLNKKIHEHKYYTTYPNSVSLPNINHMNRQILL